MFIKNNRTNLAAFEASPDRAWQLRVTVQRPATENAISIVLKAPPPVLRMVRSEKHESLPSFNPEGRWAKGACLHALRAQECTTPYLLDLKSLQLRTRTAAGVLLLKEGEDYAADHVWGTIGRLSNGRIKDGQTVYASYRHGFLRIDSVVVTRDGQICLRPGESRVAAPVPPAIQKGEHRLANVWLPGRVRRLIADHLFPILETAYPEPSPQEPTPAEKLLPRTMAKLRAGKPLRILAWGDSVTDGSYLTLPVRERWQEQFVTRLRKRFPRARIELLTEAWGGHDTDSYLSEPPGSAHNYQENVLDAKPDLIVSEFVNDAGLKTGQVERRYGKFLADFKAIGTEWIILTPHYIRPDWMGLTKERDIDNDPRPYVKELRHFTAHHQIALADAATRYGRLWRQGIPYSTLMLNSINHPDARGMKIFADSLMALFPPK